MHRIQNYATLAHTPARHDALDIIEAGLAAIDTTAIMRDQVTLEGEVLRIGYHTFTLSDYRSIRVIGFGKASCQAAAALEKILGPRITSGIAISNATVSASICATITLCESSHPLPTQQNVTNSGAIVALCESLTTDDLVIVLVSGGGSAMLCWPASECEQGARLYHAANKKGLTIQQLNTVRKHISLLKGGGLAKLLYPATVAGIIFSDVPGNNPEMVASGPTYPDISTIADAQRIITEEDLGDFTLIETPKEHHWFERVTNIVLVSNQTALEAMAATAERLGYATSIIASDMYDDPETLVAKFHALAQPHTVILGGGESRLTIAESHGKGGRNQHVALTALAGLKDGHLFASIASDGHDNGESAGGLVDTATAVRARAGGIDCERERSIFNDYPVLEASHDLVFTGTTGANVSDLMMLLAP